MPRYRVLIVDDQRDIRRVLSMGLATSEMKVEVVDVPSAEEAMLVATHGGFDLMVSDVRLPGMSGLDLVRRVQKLHPMMKVMLMTGVADPSIRREVESAGADAFFYKPIELEDFLSEVRRMLGAAAGDLGEAVETETAIPAKPLGLGDLLEGLRRRAGVGLAAVLNTGGDVISQAGFLTGVYNQPGLAVGLAAVYSSGLAVTQSLLQVDPENLFYLAGKHHHFYILSVDSEHLLVLTAEHPFKDRITALNLWLPESVRALDQALTNRAGSQNQPDPDPVGTEPLVGEPETAQVEAAGPLFRPLEDELAQVEVSEEDQAAIDALFSQAGRRQVEQTDLDDFWDSLTEESESVNLSEDSLSFDEALDLGLAPGDEEQE